MLGPFLEVPSRRSTPSPSSGMKPHSAGWGDWRRKLPNAFPLNVQWTPTGPTAMPSPSSSPSKKKAPPKEKVVHMSPRQARKVTAKLVLMATMAETDDAIAPGEVLSLVREMTMRKGTDGRMSFDFNDDDKESQVEEKDIDASTILNTSDNPKPPLPKFSFKPKAHNNKMQDAVLSRLQRPTLSRMDKSRERIRFLPASPSDGDEKGGGKQTGCGAIVRKVFEPMLAPRDLSLYMDTADNDDDTVGSITAALNRRAEVTHKVLDMGGLQQFILETSLEQWAQDVKYLNAMPIGAALDNPDPPPPKKKPAKRTSVPNVKSPTSEVRAIPSPKPITEDDIAWATLKMRNFGFNSQSNPLTIRDKIHALLQANKRADAIDLRRAMTIVLMTSTPAQEEKRSPTKGVGPSQEVVKAPRAERLEEIARSRAWMLFTSLQHAVKFIKEVRWRMAEKKFVFLLHPLMVRWLRRCRARVFVLNQNKRMAEAVRPTLEELRAASAAFRFVVSDKEGQRLVAALVLKTTPPRSIVWHKGEQAHCMYVIASGTMRDKLPSEKSTTTDFITAEKGCVLGDYALFMGIPYAMFASAGDTGCVMWCLERSATIECLSAQTQRDVRNQLQEAKYQNVFSAFALTTPVVRSSCELFARAPDCVLAALCHSVVPVEFPPGKIWRARSPAKSLFLVASGLLTEDKASFTSGHCVGWLELLFFGMPRQRVLYAEGKVLAWSISSDDFHLALQTDIAYMIYVKTFGCEQYKKMYALPLCSDAFLHLSVVPKEPHDIQLIKDLQACATPEVYEHKSRVFAKTEKPTKLLFLEQGSMEEVYSSGASITWKAPKWFGVEQWVAAAESWGYNLRGDHYAVVYSLNVVDVRAALMRAHKRRAGLKQREMVQQLMLGKAVV